MSVFSFFNANGFYLSSNDLSDLLDLLNTCHSKVADLIGHNYIYYLYSYVVGDYGHLPTSTSYVEIIENTMEAAAAGIPNCIYFPPSPPDSFISYPAL